VLLKKLYIPHGSDESSSKAEKAGRTENFISHMVQMKALCDLKSILIVS